MRLVVALVTLCLFAGCGAPTDPTPNREAVGDGDYPPGPYGYATGTTISNLSFIGKQTDAPTDFSTLPMKTLTLSDLRTDKKLIVLEGAARWCTPCNRDQPAMKALEATYGPQGVEVMEVLVEGTYGVASTEDDINRWTQMYQLGGIVAIDPEYSLSKYADLSAFPVYIVVRASTMKIEYMQVEAMTATPLGPVLDQLLAQ